MNHKLESSFNKLRRQKQLLLKEVCTVSVASFHRCPRVGKWSISQILTHLITAERLSLSYLKKKSMGMDSLQKSGFREDVKFVILKLSQRIPLRYKAPRVVIENTPPALSYAEVVMQWETLDTEIAQFLETVAEEDIHKKIYKHPYMGMLDVIHGVQFLREHIIHHQSQIKRILRVIKKEGL
ncbi:MAG TPA: DinB family protein [Ohtaekwangia sp.]|nr:DinB family protein [Ohtaekwangia sp.]